MPASSVAQPPPPGGSSTEGAGPALDPSPPARLLRKPSSRRRHTSLGQHHLLVRWSIAVPVAMAQYDQNGLVLYYTIHVTDHLHGTVRSAAHRYSEFRELHKTVVVDALPSLKKLFPPRIFTARGNRCVDEIESRRVGLGRYMSALLDALFTSPSSSSGGVGMAVDPVLEPARIATARFLQLTYSSPGGGTAAVASSFSSRPGSLNGTANSPLSLASSSRSTTQAELSIPVAGLVGTQHRPQPHAAVDTQSCGSANEAGDGAGPTTTTTTTTGSAGGTSYPTQTSSAGGAGGHEDGEEGEEEEEEPPQDGNTNEEDDCSSWEDTTDHREETWWSVPHATVALTAYDPHGTEVHVDPAASLTREGELLAAASEGTSSGGPSSFLGAKGSKKRATPVSTGFGSRRRVVGFALPLMECRLQIDGCWVLIVRHERHATSSLVRRRHAEAVHLLRQVDNAKHLPSVPELREVLRAFKSRNPERLFDDDTVRRHLAVDNAAAALPLPLSPSDQQVLPPSPNPKRIRPDAEDARVVVQRSTASCSGSVVGAATPSAAAAGGGQPRVGGVVNDDVDELDRDALSVVTDIVCPYEPPLSSSAHAGAGAGTTSSAFGSPLPAAATGGSALLDEQEVTLADAVASAPVRLTDSALRAAHLAAGGGDEPHSNMASVGSPPSAPRPQQQQQQRRRTPPPAAPSSSSSPSGCCNSLHYDYAFVTVVPWGGTTTASSKTADNTAAPLPRGSGVVATAALVVPTDSPPPPPQPVQEEVEEEEEDEDDVVDATNEQPTSSTATTGLHEHDATTTTALESFTSVSALVTRATCRQPTVKVRIASRRAVLKGCQCTDAFFCKAQNRQRRAATSAAAVEGGSTRMTKSGGTEGTCGGSGDVFATRSGHCLVIHPPPVPPAPRP